MVRRSLTRNLEHDEHRCAHVHSPRLSVLLACLPLVLQADETEQANPCLECHETDQAQFAATVHGTTECLECHVGADERRHRRGLDPVDCGGCHAEVLDEQAVSVHGPEGVRRSSGMELPIMLDCHGDVHTMARGDRPVVSDERAPPG